MRISETKLMQLVEGESRATNLVVIIDETDMSEIMITRDEWSRFIGAVLLFNREMTLRDQHKKH